jgi:hypothetical protein
MNSLKRLLVLVGVASALLVAGCATSPEPFEYQQNNELKPGPGIFTGEDGVYTIYGPPPKPAGESSGEDDPEESDPPSDP